MANKLYMVQTGETLKSIARDQLREEPRWQELAFINSLEKPYFVSPGQLILIPGTGDKPLEIVIREQGETPDKGGAAAPGVDFELSPAELGLLVGGAVFLIWWVNR